MLGFGAPLLISKKGLNFDKDSSDSSLERVPETLRCVQNFISFGHRFLELHHKWFGFRLIFYSGNRVAVIALSGPVLPEVSQTAITASQTTKDLWSDC